MERRGVFWILPQCPIPTVLFLLVVPEPENDIRNVNTTQHMSPDEGQALMKVKEEAKYEIPVMSPQITVPCHA